MRTLRIGLAGFGTVGQALVRLIHDETPRLCRLGVGITVVAIANRGVARKRVDWVRGPVRWTEDVASLASDPEVDVLVELLGGEEPARSLLVEALARGKSAVTANKLVLARHGAALSLAAKEGGAALGIEASVAGGIPVLNALREGLAGDAVTSISGILNGTCNYILTEMAAPGRAFDETLREAQRLGYAEADPSSDVEAWDPVYKLAILARLGFGQDVRVEEIARLGISGLLPCDFDVARGLGRSIRLLGVASRDEAGALSLEVRPHFVANDSPFARVYGPFNAVLVRTAHGGDFFFTGRGAGGDPTAVAVLSDLVRIARGVGAPAFPPFGFLELAPARLGGSGNATRPFCVRLVAPDASHAEALTASLEKRGVRVEESFALPVRDGVCVAIRTAATGAVLEEALGALPPGALAFPLS